MCVTFHRNWNRELDFHIVYRAKTARAGPSDGTSASSQSCPAKNESDAILKRLKTGLFSEQFKDQLRLVMRLNPETMPCRGMYASRG